VNETHYLHQPDDLLPGMTVSTPFKPAFAESVNRAYPIMFHCWDPILFDRCEKRETCACLEFASGLRKR
ncbi:hypothetical protein HDU96_002456, partial [Phlyctochytrium bullatum]